MSARDAPRLTSVLPFSTARIERYPAPSRTAEFVYGYWTLDVDTPPATISVVADGLVDLTFDLDDPTQSWVTGPASAPATFTHTRGTHLLGVSLYPDAARRVLATGLRSISPHCQPLSTLLGGDAADTVATLVTNASSTESRLEVIDGFLSARLTGGTTDDRVRAALDTIRASRGGARIDDVSRRAHTTPRQLTRLFNEWIGLSPKQFARVTRAQAALNRMKDTGDRTLADIASELNFSDHAHLSREILALTGINPREFYESTSETFKR
jgi:AraC-like DNA-binding protein